LFLVLVTSTKHYWLISAERRRDGSDSPFMAADLTNFATFSMARFASD